MLLQSALNSSYLDAMLENAENIIDNNTVRVEDGVPDKETQEKLAKIYKQLDLKNVNAEAIRQLIQLSFLKVIRKDAIQANHQMTPDTIGLLMAFLIEKVTKNTKIKTIFDPAVGTANLLTTVINQLDKDEHENIQGFGIDNDDSMLSVASVNVALQHANVDLFHQDSISALDIPQCDLAVSDLPIGYYPLDNNTKDYQTRAKEGHSFVHHLLIEQSMNYLKPGKFGVFLVPSSLFQTKEAEGFIKWVHSVAYLQGFVNLPAELFANPAAQKSILLLQRHGGDSKQAAKVLLGEFPSFKDKNKFASFMQEINDWVTTNINK
ncbi:class I SAM-dependent methyltransferase [Limosilactobacillus fastidiosus]|uniref:Class I SAM-dependent methyltransferase n=2 Tax=Limosilactobacillus fastidiosus TaxID=2759855 RepID=A0A7W3YBV6_9LACO|nr:class I SAM-dependent methyltransferase [Limosilactobacillus fastidiosus]MBB1062637.1 class I SAM-dependent methyltransferase [Limosilactobacillus fastidiosus]MBB1085441.1 class I SAM-dependent methyltransferase [Limosilactobacillus fastidiosus]MCD7083805.1 class I SAM-dependent methyltransferase [Limosilactobacillus fastidiosus]MCD7085343.1 class I SAM-dependent methyltransferase [Limosilactobacillus fastidiosus]MCD7114082.1 class I SAM-dependent methyltransferase [Limosilactobacillus fast